MPENLPWFPLYVQDFLTSRAVKAMKPHEVGCYFLLLCHEWDGGPLPLEIPAMGALIGVTPVAMRKVWEVVGNCFVRTELGYINERLESVREEQMQRFERRSKAGTVAIKKRWQGHSPAKADVYQSNTNGKGIESKSNTNREDKKIVEKKENLPSGGKRKPSGRVAMLEAWEVQSEHRTMALEYGVDVDVEEAKFRDFALNRKEPYRDLDAAFRNWIRNAQSFSPARPLNGAAAEGSGALSSWPKEFQEL